MNREVTIEFLEEKTEFRNIIFSNRYSNNRHMPICTCGQVQEDKYAYRCPKCGTSHRVYYSNYSNGNKKPLDIIAVIYYTFHLLNEKSFEVKRYDFIYRIDDENEKIDKVLKEHSSFIYDYDKEKVMLNIGEKISSDISKMGKYKYRKLTKVYYNEIVDGIMSCKDFYFKTGFKEFVDENSYWEINSFLDYIQLYKNDGYKEIELFLKAGHTKLAKELFKNPDSILGLRRGNSIKQIINLPSNIIKRIRETQSYSIKDIAKLEYVHKYGGPLTEDLYNFLTRIHVTRSLLNPIVNLVKNQYTLKEIIKYIERAELYQAIPEEETITLLADYVNMAIEKNFAYNKFPNSLKKEHDLLAREYQFVLNEIKAKEFNKAIEVCRDIEYRNAKYQIILPNDVNDLVREGRLMHHCVASYINKIANGETLVLFLRRNDAVNEPFYTIEVRNDKVCQIKGFCNKSIVETDVKAFIEEWINKKKLLYAA